MTGMHQTSRWTLWFILSLLSASSMYYYVANVWSVGQSDQFSDLYARWWGAHELLLHHRDPYSPAVTREIQIFIYGVPVATVHPGDQAELAGGFAYPIYVVFLLWPTVYLGFAVVQQLFFYLFAVLALISLLLWLYALRWRIPAAQFGILAIFTLGSFPTMQGIKLRNLSLLVAFLVAATLASLAANHFTTAGLLLAGSTIKPQFVVLLIPWLALWVMADWRRRRRLARSFVAAMSVLALGGEWFAPGWISRFWTVARAYRQYTFGHSLLDLWFSPRVGPIAASLFVLLTLAICWRIRSCPTRSAAFILSCCVLLAETLVVIPTLEPHAQLLLLPAILFLLRYSHEIRRSGKLARLLFAGTWVLLGWPWVATFAMMVASMWLPAGKLLRLWEVPLYTSPLLPFGTLVTLGFLIATKTEFPPTRGMILEA
jgi:hypothetical protein